MRILVVDDDRGVLKSLRLTLEDAGHELQATDDPERGLHLAREIAPEVVLCDVRMPSMSGLEFLEAYKKSGGEALVIMITAYGNVELALEAMKRGAYDYLEKPFSGDEVSLAVRKAEEREQLSETVQRLKSEVGPRGRHSHIVAQSEEMQEAVAQAERVARFPTSVLITGESGTGKELIAQLIHDSSPRSDEEFLTVNCGAIPEKLLESEMFGHTAGAFTGATDDREGMFEAATSGTLFLDEIAEMPLELQTKLFRTLQEREVRRLGEATSRSVDTRIVAATARDLEEMVEEATFREELYFRINVVRIHLPPLRERPEDIPPLVEYFVSRFTRESRLVMSALDTDAMQMLMKYEWPGNVRELENVVERVLVYSNSSTLTASDIEESMTGPERGFQQDVGSLSADDLSVKEHTANLEARLIERALKVSGGNRTEAAELVDLSYRALLYKVDDYELG